MPIEVRNDPSPYFVGPLAHGTGVNEATHRERARQDELYALQAQMAQRAQLQREQIAAQQQSQVFQHQAGLQDNLQRAALGEYGNQQQFGRQVALDQQNFVQQKEYADYQDKIRRGIIDFELNANGRREKARLDAQESAIRKAHESGFLSDDSFNLAMGRHATQFANVPWQSMAGADPNDIEKAWSSMKPTDDGLGWKGVDENGLPKYVPNTGAMKKQLTELGAADRKETTEIVAAQKREAAEQAKQDKAEARQAALELKRLELREKLRESMENSGLHKPNEIDAALQRQEDRWAKDDVKHRSDPQLSDIASKNDPKVAAAWDWNYGDQTGRPWNSLSADQRAQALDIMKNDGRLPEADALNDPMIAAQYQSFRRKFAEEHGRVLPDWQYMSPEQKSVAVGHMAMGQAAPSPPQRPLPPGWARGPDGKTAWAGNPTADRAQAKARYREYMESHFPPTPEELQIAKQLAQAAGIVFKE